MFEQPSEDGRVKLVVVEVADVFLSQNNFETIPDEDLEPAEWCDWIRTEDKATRRVMRQVTAKMKGEGFNPRPSWIMTVDQVRAHLDKKHPERAPHALPLGLNGMYLLRFVKPAPVQEVAPA